MPTGDHQIMSAMRDERDAVVRIRLAALWRRTDLPMRRKSIREATASQQQANCMGTTAATVYLIVDDPAVLGVLTRLLAAEGYDVRPYICVTAFLVEYDSSASGCVILDLAIPELNDPQVLRHLSQDSRSSSVSFLPAHDELVTSVAAMKAGAIEFLIEPVNAEMLLESVRRATEFDEQRRRDLRHKLPG
jgi:FixJ family two-component response regulator